MNPCLRGLFFTLLLFETSIAQSVLNVNSTVPVPTYFDHNFIAINSTHFLAACGRTQPPNTNSIQDTLYDTSLPDVNALILNATDTFNWSISDTTFKLIGSTANVLSNTNVAIMFGTDSISSPNTQENNVLTVFNPDTSATWNLQSSGPVPAKRHHHLTFYSNTTERIFVVGGIVDNSGGLFSTAVGEAGSVDFNLYYLDLDVGPDGSKNATVWPETGTWNTVEPPDDAELMQAGLAAASGVLAGDFIVYCFGSTFGSDHPTNKCTVFNTLTLEYVQPDYKNIEMPSEREGASMIYIEKTKEIILFGGMNLQRNEFLNDVWVMDASQLPEIRWRKRDDSALEASSTNGAPTATQTEFASDKNTTTGEVIVPRARAFHGAAVLQETKVLIYGGYGPDGVPIVSNVSVLDTKDLSWKPYQWQPRDGFSTSNPTLRYVAYTGVALGIALVGVLLGVSLVMCWKVYVRKTEQCPFSKKRRRQKPVRTRGSEAQLLEMGTLGTRKSFSTLQTYQNSAQSTLHKEPRVLGMYEEDEELEPYSQEQMHEDNPFNDISPQKPPSQKSRFTVEGSTANSSSSSCQDNEGESSNNAGWKKQGRFQVLHESSSDEDCSPPKARKVGRFTVVPNSPSLVEEASSSAMPSSSPAFAPNQTNIPSVNTNLLTTPQVTPRPSLSDDDGYGSLGSINNTPPQTNL